MEVVDKRKRTDDGELNGKRRKAHEDENGVNRVIKMATTEDDEVDEFFAILRRIHVAVKYFEKKRNGEGDREFTAWRPCFQWQDFEQVNGVKNLAGREESGYLDLNADPEAKREELTVNGAF
ncbi:protein NIM1-INTERACTING 2-like [Cornus florida]|uniref:protein NIM1-INTERACTING 2-like n=1 Tax=Cornus florida TaxID=4283 RepID=UPI0028A2B156|nr:protein NIM1-INTERACTING 2-like [Cornus florida]